MDKIQKIFAKKFSRWLKKNCSDVTQKEIGKEFEISQGQVSNVINGRRCSNETWRRMVAKKIDMDYDTMIGIEKDQNKNIYKLDDITIEHQGIIPNFLDKKTGKEINENLLIIESADPKKFYKLAGRIETIAENLDNDPKEDGNQTKSVG